MSEPEIMAAGQTNDFFGIYAYGYFRPPRNGDYNFFLSADNNAEIWM
jgi:hypothetical protein